MMGEIADDMVDGTSCCLCGQYFAHPTDDGLLYVHGYPAVCWDCWKTLTKKERKEYQRAEVSTVNKSA